MKFEHEPHMSWLVLSRDNLRMLNEGVERGDSEPRISRSIRGHLVVVTVEDDAAHYADRPGHPAAVRVKELEGDG